jgi:uncharacterized protein YbjT (DUF2867 family)
MNDMNDFNPPDSNPANDLPVFVSGASGYIGGRLVPRLLEAGYRVRCLARKPQKLASRVWASHPNVEIVAGDVEETEGLTELLRGCGATYYLVHSMIAAGADYADQDRRLAVGFAEAAAAAGVQRIIYLGGLGETGEDLSEHLSSRREVESALAATGVPVTVFRAAMIIGSGSASFEILRYLVERLPVMITPRWVHTENQPIAVRNVLHYLITCLRVPQSIGRTLDIGGSEVLTYHDITQIMAEELGLPRRWVIPVPVLTPRLSSLWIHLVTPLSSKIARPLAEGLRNRVVCRDDEAHRMMPQRLLTVREAIHAALGRIADGQIETSWSDAGVIPGDPDWAGGTTYVHREETVVETSPAKVFRTLCRIGGENGWYAADALWQIRGLLDRMVGGPGLRRGRRSADDIKFGDALDFWRVTGIEPDKSLSLRAEMKVPGVAMLQFELEPRNGSTQLAQIARFQPRGLLGILYWYGVMPLHGYVFRKMLSGIKEAAEADLDETRNGELGEVEAPKIRT